jgi:hypothetical protein
MQRAIQTPEDFDRALEEAREHLEGLPTAQCDDAEPLDELLRRIAAYHEQNAVVQTDRVQDELRAFEDHLRAYGRHWPAPDSRLDHWAPMVGGSVKPRLT